MDYQVFKKYTEKSYDDLMKTVMYIEIDNGGKITPDSLDPDQPIEFISENEIVFHMANKSNLVSGADMVQRVITKPEDKEYSELIQW